ncbi:MAG: alpha-ketoacid dehydrogenase subunit beta [Planctomycetota bacterium]|nr:alpha-ketoacid dehydrogenase subunit beta [Planctomycetota bacterium]
MSRHLTYAQAILEATDLCLGADPNVYLMGLGVPDPKGIFGTTLGLREKYGARVLDMPTSENGMTGVALGSAVVGMRPILTHQRVDFALLSMEQLANEAAKWHYMFGGIMKAPMVVRSIIGRGWGNGPQHSQSLQAWFAHVPGLKVVMPATPHDAKGLLIASVEDDNPVIFLEHRWLHYISGPVPEGRYTEPLGVARVLREGRDVTIAALSYMSLEAHKAARMLAERDIDAEIVDVRSLRPFDAGAVARSVEKTGRLIVADTGWEFGGFSAEIVAQMAERCFGKLKAPPRRVALPDCPTPTSAALSKHYYPRAIHVARAAAEMLGRQDADSLFAEETGAPLDVPDKSFTGPF